MTPKRRDTVHILQVLLRQYPNVQHTDIEKSFLYNDTLGTIVGTQRKRPQPVDNMAKHDILLYVHNIIC